MATFTNASKSSAATLTHTSKSSVATFTNLNRDTSPNLWSAQVQPWLLQYPWRYGADGALWTFTSKN